MRLAVLGAGGLLPWRVHHQVLEHHGGSRLEAFWAHPSVLWLAELGPLHNPEFKLDPSILPVGASIMARVVEKRLPLAG